VAGKSQLEGFSHQEERSVVTYPLIWTIWNDCFEGLKGIPRKQWVAPEWAHVQLDGVLHRLQFQQSIQSYQNIADAKLWWIQSVLKATKQEVDNEYCCILSCKQYGSYLRMNSMNYCELHRGLALVYGMRHCCNMCMLFSLLCMKSTGHDDGHKYNYLRRLSIPVVEKGSHELYLAHLKIFCTDRFNPQWEQTRKYCDKIGQHSYWDDITKQEERVPENTFVYVSSKTGGVTAWVHIEVLRNDQWVALGPREADVMQRVITAADDTYKDIHGLALPCAIYGEWKSGYRSYTQRNTNPDIRGKAKRAPHKRPSKKKKKKV
jgi:hypothetical protein